MNLVTRPRHRQRGMTTVGLILVVAVIAFFSTLAIKLTPVYIESFQISSIFKTLQRDIPLATASDSDIRSSLAKRFDINSINDIQPRQVVIKRDGDRLQALQLKYDVRVPMFWNIDVVVHFNKDFEVTH